MSTRSRRLTAPGALNPATIQFLDVARLRKELEVRGLDATGHKAVLASRLEEAVSLTGSTLFFDVATTPTAEVPKRTPKRKVKEEVDETDSQTSAATPTAKKMKVSDEESPQSENHVPESSASTTRQHSSAVFKKPRKSAESPAAKVPHLQPKQEPAEASTSNDQHKEMTIEAAEPNDMTQATPARRSQRRSVKTLRAIESYDPNGDVDAEKAGFQTQGQPGPSEPHVISSFAELTKSLPAFAQSDFVLPGELPILQETPAGNAPLSEKSEALTGTPLKAPKVAKVAPVPREKATPAVEEIRDESANEKSKEAEKQETLQAANSTESALETPHKAPAATAHAPKNPKITMATEPAPKILAKKEKNRPADAGATKKEAKAAVASSTAPASSVENATPGAAGLIAQKTSKSAAAASTPSLETIKRKPSGEQPNAKVKDNLEPAAVGTDKNDKAIKAADSGAKTKPIDVGTPSGTPAQAVAPKKTPIDPAKKAAMLARKKPSVAAAPPAGGIDLLDTIISKQDAVLRTKYRSEKERAAELQKIELEKRRQSSVSLGLGPMEKRNRSRASGSVEESSVPSTPVSGAPELIDLTGGSVPHAYSRDPLNLASISPTELGSPSGQSTHSTSSLPSPAIPGSSQLRRPSLSHGFFNQPTVPRPSSQNLPAHAAPTLGDRHPPRPGNAGLTDMLVPPPPPPGAPPGALSARRKSRFDIGPQGIPLPESSRTSTSPPMPAGIVVPLPAAVSVPGRRDSTGSLVHLTAIPPPPPPIIPPPPPPGAPPSAKASSHSATVPEPPSTSENSNILDTPPQPIIKTEIDACDMPAEASTTTVAEVHIINDSVLVDETDGTSTSVHIVSEIVECVADVGDLSSAQVEHTQSASSIVQVVQEEAMKSAEETTTESPSDVLAAVKRCMKDLVSTVCFADKRRRHRSEDELSEGEISTDSDLDDEDTDESDEEVEDEDAAELRARAEGTSSTASSGPDVIIENGSEDDILRLLKNPKALLEKADNVLKSLTITPKTNENQYEQMALDPDYAEEETDDKPLPDFHGEPVPEDDDDMLFEMAANTRGRKNRDVVVKVEDEPLPDDEFIELDYYNADMNVKADKNNKWLIDPDNADGFALMWGGVRANYGVVMPEDPLNFPRIVFQIKIVEFLSLKHVPFEELEPHDVRVGWSVGDGNILGEQRQSYAFCSLARKANSSCFQDYGDPFHVGDVITTVLDLEASEISYFKNDISLGVAFSSLNFHPGDAVFPHVATKNCKVLVNFGRELPEEAVECWKLPEKFRDVDEAGVVTLDDNAEDAADGPARFDKLPVKFVGNFNPRLRGLAPSRRPPPDKSLCTVIMMVGLPGVGKSTWVRQYLKDHPDEHWVLLNTDMILNAMKVNGMPRRRVHQGRWDMVMGLTAKALNRAMQMACRRRHNYIIDQTNVSRDARKRRLGLFKDFQKKCVVILPSEEKMEERQLRQMRMENVGQVPAEAMLELKAVMSIPDMEQEPIDDVVFIEPPVERINEAIELVKRFNEDGKPWLRSRYQTRRPEPMISDNRDMPNQWVGNGGHSRGNFNVTMPSARAALHVNVNTATERPNAESYLSVHPSPITPPAHDPSASARSKEAYAGFGGLVPPAYSPAQNVSSAVLWGHHRASAAGQTAHSGAETFTPSTRTPPQVATPSPGANAATPSSSIPGLPTHPPATST